MSFRLALQLALLAGALAGATAGVFHLFASEPVVERAIGLEELAKAGATVEVQLVSREAQRVGLVVGFVLYGLAFGLLFAVVHALVQRAFPDTGGVMKGVTLAGIAYWCLALAPFLKYPANPPGVGEPDTVEFRQAALVGFMALSVAGAALSSLLPRYLRSLAGNGSARRFGWWLPVAANAGCFALLYTVMPSSPDPIALPSALVLEFRGLSLAGLTLFWVTFGAIFGFTLHRSHGRAAIRASFPAGSGPGR